MEIQQFSHITAINIHQVFDKQAAKNLSWLISTASQFTAKEIVLNMTDVSHATIYGLKHLFEDFQKYRPAGIKFSILNPNQETASLLTMAGFWLVFKRYDGSDLVSINQSLQTDAPASPSSPSH
jgi:anti-anti-sigma factor